jgi:hypothetical protein
MVKKFEDTVKCLDVSGKVVIFSTSGDAVIVLGTGDVDE